MFFKNKPKCKGIRGAAVTRRHSLLSHSGVAALVFAACVAQPAHARAIDGDPQAALKQLQQEAKQARRDAEEALERAKKAEAAINNLLANQPASPAPLPQTSPDLASAPACKATTNGLERIDCFDTSAKDRNGAPPSPTGLMAYSVKTDKDDNEGDMLAYLNKLEDQGDKKAKRNVSFMQVAQPVTSRLLITKGSEAFEATYTYPLARRRALTEDSLSSIPITTNLTVGFSAAIDPDDKTTGLLFRDGSFNNDTVALTVSWGQQFYAPMPLYGEKGSIEARAKAFGQSLWEQCDKASKASATIYGDPPKKPNSCQGDDLIAWSFDPSRETAYKVNVAAYNAAFWDPVTASVPQKGWGIVGGVGTRNFKFIDPASFEPGIVADPLFPRLLTTLSTTRPDNGGLFLDEQGDRRWSGEIGVYGFRHYDMKWGPFDGLLARIDLNLAKRWRFDASEKDQEFCAFKGATPGIGECKKFNIAAPEDHWSFEPSINLRTQLKFGESFPRLARFVPALALSPRFTHNSDTSAYRLEVPLFLSGNDKQTELTGGIRYVTTWNDEIEANNISVWSVFVSTPFTLDGSKK